MKHEASISWKPKVKSRPRTGNGRVYTDSKTLAAEKSIRDQWLEHAATNGWEPFPEGTLVAVRLLLQSDTIKVEVESVEPREVGTGLRNRDADNMAKLVLDALNKIAYADDRQIVELLVVKGES